MKIAVAHHSLNIPGGAERLCLSVIEALRSEGHDVSLITVEKTDWKLVRTNFGSVVLPNFENYVTSSRISGRLASVPVSSAYFSIFMLQILAAKSRRNYHVVINTFGDAINSIADLTYVHFPLRAALNLSQIPAFSNKAIWQALAPFYSHAMSCVDRLVPGSLLTNSEFMRGIIRRFLHRDSLVVYPPVDVRAFAGNFTERKHGSTVAVVASYTPKRHLELVPLIAKHSEHAEFVIMGKAGEYSSPTLTSLSESIRKLRVEDRIKLLKNVPFATLAEKLKEAKVYLHMMPHDHFGISLVEAMASGCVPVVHKSGGPWIDILDRQQGTFGFSFTTASEAAKCIDALVTDEDLRSKIALRGSQRAWKFDRTVFNDRIVKVVEKVAC